MDLQCRFECPQVSLLTEKFALTAGLSSLGSPHFVVVAGLAELFSGAISMGVGGYLSTKAERDNYRYLLRQTRQRVEMSCSTALQQEVFNILAPYGVTSADCQRLVQSLEKAEKTGSDTGDHDKGLTQFLLKFGTGVETISSWRLYASALTIGISYFIGGLIPMVRVPLWSQIDIRYPISLCYQPQKLSLYPLVSRRLCF